MKRKQEKEKTLELKNSNIEENLRSDQTKEIYKKKMRLHPDQ